MGVNRKPSCPQGAESKSRLKSFVGRNEVINLPARPIGAKMKTISVPKGLLRLAALKMFSESSLSGSDLQREIMKYSTGVWSPGPGSIYFLLAELRKKELLAELPHQTGTTRRYVISRKGREELARLSRGALAEVRKQLELLSLYSRLTGNEAIHGRIREMVDSLTEDSSAQ